MNITHTLKELKRRPDFAENVGMILIHNGTARGWSRSDHQAVYQLEVTPDYDKIEQIRQQFLQNEGIYEIIIEAKAGTFLPGEDLLYIIVAGDIRENVKQTLSDLLDTIKAEATIKKEIKTQQD